MWFAYQKGLGIKYLSVMVLYVLFAVVVVGIQMLFWKYTTSNGEDMVDRTNLLI